MASLINIKTSDGRGVLRAVQFVAPDGRRPIIRLGRIPEKTARAACSHIEALLNTKITGQAAPRDTAIWVAELSDKWHAKLASAGLLAPRAASVGTKLGPFFTAYIKARAAVLKERTQANLKQVKRRMVGHFGDSRELATITKGDAGDWHRGLRAAGLAAATIAMHVKKARQVFADAVDRKLIAENPVRGIKAGSMENKERFVYVETATIEKVIDACPDAEWKLIFALARYGALRVPSEIQTLKWQDVIWDAGQMLVRATKTAHHRNKGVRRVPIVPQLMIHLRAAFDLAGSGAVYAVVAHRQENLRTMAEKIIDRAGVTPWGKLFQNLRSSCETDWTASFPLHVACAWAGNTEAVAKQHYLQVTEDHFARAAGKSAAESAANNGEHQRTLASPECEKPAFQRAFAGNAYPQGESNKDVFRRGMEGVKGPALRKALRRLRIASPTLYHHVVSTRFHSRGVRK